MSTTSYNYSRLATRKKRKCRKCFPVLSSRKKKEEPVLLSESQQEEAWERIEDCLLNSQLSQIEEDVSSQEEEGRLLERGIICRCRQGRSAESRRRVDLQRRIDSWDPRRIREVCPDPDCPGGGKGDVVFDFRNNETICTVCGTILVDVMACGDFDRTLCKVESKPYATPVYAREKLRALNKSDPAIYPDEWELIDREARTLYGWDFKDFFERKLGQRTFARLCKSVKNEEGVAILANKKYGERWIQVSK